MYNLRNQKTETLAAYIEYVEAKIDADEIPLDFDQWANIETLPETESQLEFSKPDNSFFHFWQQGKNKASKHIKT